MQRALTNFILPGASVAMIAVVIFFPSPSDLNVAVKTATSPFLTTTIARGVSNAAFIVEDYADGVPGLTRQLANNADCFIGLDSASPARLEECAPAVTSIIAQIVQYQDNPGVSEALRRGGEGNLLPRIQVAAAEVCRSLWSTGEQADAYLDNPACRMAQVTLARSWPIR